MFVQRVKIVFNFETKKISMTEKNILRFMKNHFIAESSRITYIEPFIL